MIIIVDFGSQSTHLISRRLREISVPSKLVEPETFFEQTAGETIDGIILSGGPQSVYDDASPRIDAKVFELGKPVLGICYGLQYLAHNLGGKVEPGKHKEMGPATLTILQQSPLFLLDTPDGSEEYITAKSAVWMSHGDQVTSLPEGFTHIGKTETTDLAAFANEARRIYGVQFHPELVHTQFGMQILKNFARMCGFDATDRVIDREFVEQIVADIKDSIGGKKVISALSGGVDSSIATLLVHEAVGDNLTAVYIDSGLMREGETETLERVFAENYKMTINVVHAKDEFLAALKGVTDPEEKRKAIGRTFIKVLDREAQALGAEFLVQGTIWPDVIESAGSKHSSIIKSHHNVGGLPKDMKLILVEPIRNYYKDEVRAIGGVLGLPREITHRKPFPGPGLAVRIVGEVTQEKIDIVRKADSIVQQEIEAYDGKDALWQIFAVLTGVKSTGVGGDYRSYGECIAIRAVESTDAMSAHWARIPYDILGKISTRITNEIQAVNRVVYDITDKPPGTIEWE
ncbi:MAG: glutamine-hydrolyzing GMP synthase [Patescibacteria group bacterium]|nr:glutamine-hydrolyzing GMP synthase [Patescibacteria group bacterium]